MTENVWKRSVMGQMRTKREEVLSGTGIGEDCAIFSFGSDGLSAVSVYSVAWEGEKAVKHAVYGAVNAVAASGAEPVAIVFSAVFPSVSEESFVKERMAELEDACRVLHVQAAKEQIRVTGAVNCPVFTVTGYGRLAGCAGTEEGIGTGIKTGSKTVPVHKILPGQDIVASKWAGLEGTSVLARARERELSAKYPFRFIEEAKGFDRFLSVVPEAATAVKSGVCAMHSASEGGIFGALWELAEGAGVGLEIDLKKIPIKQETIEICEFFEINPYCLTAGGCLLMAADNGYDLAGKLAKEHIPAAVIGKTTDGNDRIIRNEEEQRFLELPKPDELYKILS